jgi:two-component system C4-dicarboxylate transport sensor histidine kinase DctB
VRTEDAQDAIHILVEDNGPGIAAEVLPRIFDPFFSTKEPGRGLGLGLSISYNIMHDFGGRLDVENRAEGGARFIITLLRADAAREVAAQ